MADELLTNRPWSWWEFEAAAHCRHAPRCAVPDGSRERDRWLDYHGLLTARERALKAQVADG
ncbi:MAG TPA: hypothetical protein VK923_02950 [Euzebyales bacterium]|nr:hypothetical protein [Euzebyales bacterium]